MRNLLLGFTLLGFTGALVLAQSLGTLDAAPQSDLKQEKQLVKSHQKEQRKAFKLQQKYKKEAMKEGQAPRAVRIQEKHQMEREARALRQRQRDELQDLKDRERMIKESQGTR